MGIKVSEIKTEVCPTNSLETTKKVGTPKHDNIMVFPPQENTVLKKSENNEEPKSSVLPKILLASLGIFSGLVLTVAAKGPIRKFKNFRAIPKDLRGIFKSIKNKENDEFVQCAYSELSKHFGIEKNLPNSFSLRYQKDVAENICKYDFAEHALTVNNYFHCQPKEKQFLILTNGLKQCKEVLTREINSIPEELRTAFSSLRGLKGKEFAEAAYPKLVSYMKLDGIAPKKLRIVKPTEIDKFGFAAGGYHPTYNEIYINEKLLFEMSQKRMLDILAHELKHCEQHTNMCRLAGMTPDKYARVLAEGAVNRAINGGNGITGYFYKRAVQEGNGQKFIEENVQNVIRKNIEKIKSAFASVFKAPKISPDSPEGKKALLQLESLKTYGGYSRHYEEPIEIEAHEWGNKIKNFFQKFLELKL